MPLLPLGVGVPELITFVLLNIIDYLIMNKSGPASFVLLASFLASLQFKPRLSITLATVPFQDSGGLPLALLGFILASHILLTCFVSAILIRHPYHFS
jgi:hypothetical protein